MSPGGGGGRGGFGGGGRGFPGGSIGPGIAIPGIGGVLRGEFEERRKKRLNDRYGSPSDRLDRPGKRRPWPPRNPDANTAGNDGGKPKCRRRGGCGERPGGTSSAGNTTPGSGTYDPNCRRRGGCRPQIPGTNSAGNTPGTGGTHDPNCRRGRCGKPGGATTTDNDNYDPNCRRRGGCRPDRYPTRPPVVIVIPGPSPVPPDYVDEPRPERIRPVYEPSTPSRERTAPERAERRPQPPAPPTPTPPAALTTPPAPMPTRRAFATAERPQFRPRELLVIVQAPEPNTVAQQLAQAFNIVQEESQDFTLLPDRRVFRFSIPDNRAVETVAGAVATTPGVTRATPNFAYYVQGTAGTQSLALQYALPKLRVHDALDLATGRGVTVAVIDSGVDTEHPALKQADITFYDAVDGGVKSPDQHGTAITGIIAGQGDMR